MFNHTPIELLVKDFSNILNKSQSAYELVSSRRYNEPLAILTTGEAYTLIEKAYLRCDQTKELQTEFVAKFFNAFEDFYFELKQVLFHDDDDLISLKERLQTLQDRYEEVSTNFNLF
ncbi:MAG: hypothetical protein ACK5MW_03095 [Enterococcus sp.]